MRMLFITDGEITRGIKADQEAKKHDSKNDKRADSVNGKTKQLDRAVAEQGIGDVGFIMQPILPT